MALIKDKKSGLMLPEMNEAQYEALLKEIKKSELKAKDQKSLVKQAMYIAKSFAVASNKKTVTREQIAETKDFLNAINFDAQEIESHLKSHFEDAYLTYFQIVNPRGDSEEIPTENLTEKVSCKRTTNCFAAVVQPNGKTKQRKLKRAEVKALQAKETAPDGVDEPQGWLGLPSVLMTPGAQGRKDWRVQYVLARRDAVTASHTTRFQPSPNYPKHLQERSYDRDQNEQQKVIRQALDWRAAFVLNDDPTSQSGPPIVDKRWLVLGGNSRMIAINMLCQDPARALKYAAALRFALDNHAQDWGLSTLSDLADLSDYVPIRVLLDEFDETTISQQLNRGFTNTLNVSGESVSCGRALPKMLIQYLAERLTEVDTIEQALEGQAAGRVVVQMLKKADVITPETQARWVRSARGQYLDELSRSGAETIKRCLVGAVVDSQDVLANATPSTAAFFERIAPAWLAILDRVPAWRGSFQMAAAELTEVLDYPAGQRSHRFTQGSLFGVEDGAGNGQLILKDPVAVSLLVWMYCHRLKPKEAAVKSRALYKALGQEAGGLFGALQVEDIDPEFELARVLGATDPADVEEGGALRVLARLEDAEACKPTAQGGRAARAARKRAAANPTPPPFNPFGPNPFNPPSPRVPTPAPLDDDGDDDGDDAAAEAPDYQKSRLAWDFARVVETVLDKSTRKRKFSVSASIRYAPKVERLYAYDRTEEARIIRRKNALIYGDIENFNSGYTTVNGNPWLQTALKMFEEQDIDDAWAALNRSLKNIARAFARGILLTPKLQKWQGKGIFRIQTSDGGSVLDGMFVVESPRGSARENEESSHSSFVQLGVEWHELPEKQNLVDQIPFLAVDAPFIAGGGGES